MGSFKYVHLNNYDKNSIYFLLFEFIYHMIYENH